MWLGVRNQREPVWDAGGTSRTGKGIEGMRSGIAYARTATSEIGFSLEGKGNVCPFVGGVWVRKL